MIALAALAFILPVGRPFFQFDLPAPLLWQSLVVGAVGAVAVEMIYQRPRRVRRVEHTIGREPQVSR